MFTKRGGRGRIPESDFWPVITGIGGIPTNELDIDPKEFGLFPKSDDSDFLMRILDTINLRNILVSSISKYNHMREDLAQELAPYTTFIKENGKPVGNVEITLTDNPRIHRKVLESNDLLLQILKLCDDGYEVSVALAEQFNKKMKEAFPDREFQFKMHIPVL